VFTLFHFRSLAGSQNFPIAMSNSLLLQKYNTPVPRYTSYPTVPYWDDQPILEKQWIQHIRAAFAQDGGISLYIHLPYCEKLCTYCGCNKRITTNHGVEEPYVATILKEWALYLKNLPGRPLIKELHLGGGTPTFFHPDQLDALISRIFEHADVAPEVDFGFEAHPFSTTREHLVTLYNLGFRRISVGVQDFAPEILEIINRQQTELEVQQVTQWAREIGYTSVNYDLIYGLPLQTPEHVRTTMHKLETLRPDRIAFYSYAHVPWIKPSQRAYSEADLPLGEAKRALYELGRDLLEEMGYLEIGMDHFALPKDQLSKSMQRGTLHRNFMGYTPHYTRLSIALGASSISDSWDGFMQNEKVIEDYQKAVELGRFPISKGHLLSEEDQIIRTHILNIMCRYETDWSNPELQCETFEDIPTRLEELEADGLIEVNGQHLRVTERGRPFLRNICLAFDARYWQKQPGGKLFSQAI
jgi:oxygen-independent coproporphyrinogen-3 oxidase